MKIKNPPAYQSNAAMKLVSQVPKSNPRAIAQAIVNNIPASPLIEKVLSNQ